MNPFQDARREAQARSAARIGAPSSGVYIIINCAIQIAFSMPAAPNTYRNAGLGAIISDIVCVVSAFLTWQILAQQALWATIFIAHGSRLK
jgi:hypothetical protein